MSPKIGQTRACKKSPTIFRKKPVNAWKIASKLTEMGLFSLFSLFSTFRFFQLPYFPIFSKKKPPNSTYRNESAYAQPTRPSSDTYSYKSDIDTASRHYEFCNASSNCLFA